MATNNISKYVQLNDFLLLEYEFNKDASTVDLSAIESRLAVLSSGGKQYFNVGGQGDTNNDLDLNSVPLASNRSKWYINPDDVASYYNQFDSWSTIAQDEYRFDTVKVHIVSGYNFDDIPGFLLQVRAKDTSDNFVDLANFTWINQVVGNEVLKFSLNTLYLANKFYDKYVELKIPSIESLGGQTAEPIESALNIKALSDVYFTYTTIPEIDGNNYIAQEKIELQLPTISQADNFNAFIAQSSAGDFIEFYATWNDIIIGESIADIESGRIPLYTSNDPNDNYQEFADQYGIGTNKWVIMHELSVYEHIGQSSLITQQYVFTQENNFNSANYFRPVIKNSDIASSYSINYICRLTNRMDGSQIIRKASFTSKDPAKYGKFFTRLNINNYTPYKVFNRIEGEASTIVNIEDNRKTQFVKVYFDTTNVLLNMNNDVLPQGTGPLFLKKADGTYKLQFEKIDENAGDKRVNVDLSGAFQYSINFMLDDDTLIEVSPTFSTNMNTTLGELEFKLMEPQVTKLLKQNNNSYSILIKNPDGSKYTFYEGVYFAYTNYQEVISQYSSLFNITALQGQVTTLESEKRALIEENTILKNS